MMAGKTPQPNKRDGRSQARSTWLAAAESIIGSGHALDDVIARRAQPEQRSAARPAQDPHLLRAIGRASGWWQRLERGDVATLADLAADEGLSDRYVSRVLRLAWLAPEVLERLVVHREPSTISISRG